MIELRNCAIFMVVVWAGLTGLLGAGEFPVPGGAKGAKGGDMPLSAPPRLAGASLAIVAFDISLEAVTLQQVVDHVLGRAILSPAQAVEADVNQNGRVEVGDVVKMIQGTPAPTPTPTPSPTPGGGAPPASFFQQEFNVGYDAGLLDKDAIDLLAEAVWAASEFNGWVETHYGTLTQTAPNSDDWTYSSTPADKLIVVFSGGPTVEFVITQFDGYKGGGWKDFTYSHDVNFTVFIAGVRNQQIISSTAPLAAGKYGWTRQIIGTKVYDGETVTMNVTHTGWEDQTVDSGWAEYEYEDEYTGTASSPSGQYTISQRAWGHLIHTQIGDDRHIQNHQLWNSSSATEGGHTYAYVNATVRWEQVTNFDQGYYNVVTEPDYWIVGGTMTKDGVLCGTLKFDIPVMAYTPGPDLVLHLTTGEEVFLHTLIAYP